MGNCGSSPNYEDVFINVEYNSSLGDQNQDEENLSQDVNNITESDVLNRFNSYQDAQILTNEAISHPNEESRNAAWDAILPNVEFQSHLYDYAFRVSNILVKAFKYLIENIDIDNKKFQHYSKIGPEALEDFPKAMNCLCEIGKISIQYDSIKLKVPKLLGDLAYFRRSASKMPCFTEYEDLFGKTSQMTIFFGDSNPALSACLNDLAAEYSKEDSKNQALTLIQMAIDGLTATVTFHPFENSETNIKVLYGITFLILLYDKISTSGAFHAKTPINISSALEAIRNFEPKQTELINAIIYTSKHFSDPTTPPNIANIFK